MNYTCTLENYLLKLMMEIKTHMRIESSLEWVYIETKLQKKAVGFRYYYDLLLMIKNIQKKVTELSKAEVDARRGFSNQAEKLLIDINNDIQMIEEYMLVAALIG